MSNSRSPSAIPRWTFTSIGCLPANWAQPRMMSAQQSFRPLHLVASSRPTIGAIQNPA